MRDLGGADPECIGAERAVRRGVAVAADDQQARQAQSLFRSDHVHDALSRVVQSEQPDRVLGRIVLDLPHHARDLGIGDIVTRAAGRNVMVGDREGQAGLGHAGTALRQPGECVKGAFMHVMAVDPEQQLAVLAAHDLVRRPQLVDQGARVVHARIRCLVSPRVSPDNIEACGDQC